MLNNKLGNNNRNNIRMKFEIEKLAVSVMHMGRPFTNGFHIPDKSIIHKTSEYS